MKTEDRNPSLPHPSCPRGCGDRHPLALRLRYSPNRACPREDEGGNPSFTRPFSSQVIPLYPNVISEEYGATRNLVTFTLLHLPCSVGPVSHWVGRSNQFYFHSLASPRPMRFWAQRRIVLPSRSFLRRGDPWSLFHKSSPMIYAKYAKTISDDFPGESM